MILFLSCSWCYCSPFPHRLRFSYHSAWRRFNFLFFSSWHGGGTRHIPLVSGVLTGSVECSLYGLGGEGDRDAYCFVDGVGVMAGLRCYSGAWG